MNRAEARAGEHGVGRLRDHRHVDGDAVALGDVAVAQDVGHPAHLVVQLLIGDLLVVLGIVAFPDDRDLVGARGQVPVDAVVGDVGDAVLVPLDRDVAGVVDVLDLGRCLVPVEALGLVLPERARVRDRALVHFEVAGLVDEGALLPLGRNVVNLVGHRFLHATPSSRPKRSPLFAPIMRRRSDKRQGRDYATFGGPRAGSR